MPTDDAEKQVIDVSVEPAAPEAETPEEQDAEESQSEGLPATLPVLPLRDNVAFPGMVLPFHIEGEGRIKTIEQILLEEKLFLAVAPLREPEDGQEPTPEILARVGTTCVILQMLRMPDGTVRFLAQGVGRSAVVRFIAGDVELQADVLHLQDTITDDMEFRALYSNLREQFSHMVELLPNAGVDLELSLANTDDAGPLCDLVASHINLSVPERQEVLEALDIGARMRLVTKLLAREMEFAETARRIQDDARNEIEESQREYYLRQQLKAIQDELGEADPQATEMAELREQIAEKHLPEEVQKEADREMGRLERINPASPEYSVSRTYLDWIIGLPWNDSTEDNLNLGEARDILDEDHYGLKDVKERVLEFLAVCKLRGELSGSILCFVGPPGTGKTSIGKSIARAMGRKYVRVALGGTRDEAEIRGHRRTYIGSLPGRIITALRKTGSNNPVFMLDEVDKLGADFRGDPASALLEVLDPEQNDTYTDHYLEVPFDLSRVMFICTANLLDTVPYALRDRMEVIEFPGYTQEEKVQIARRYLIPNQMTRNGLTGGQYAMAAPALRKVIEGYTRESGVRNLDREIASLCRKTAKKIALGDGNGGKVSADDVEALLGPVKFISEVAQRVSEPGVAAGLAWTPSGGDILFIESTMTPGKGKLILTGQLGDVMKESARAALTFVHAHAALFGIDHEMFEKNDFHIHVPAGGIPKDGPSAGVTMAMALCSLCTGRKLRHDVAMTGEITLRGLVLPVGGIKEKVLAACRAGIKTVVLPSRNEKDLRDVPDYAKKKLKFEVVDRVEDMVPLVMLKGRKKRQ
jgi:ATP-dependent Lon protease